MNNKTFKNGGGRSGRHRSRDNVVPGPPPNISRRTGELIAALCLSRCTRCNTRCPGQLVPWHGESADPTATAYLCPRCHERVSRSVR